MKIVRTLGFVALLAAGGAAVWWSYAAPLQVQAVQVSRGSAADVVYATGTVEPRRWAKVTTIVRERIVELCRCEGEAVKAGDVLGRLDDSSARATLAELEARVDFAKSELERGEGLLERRIISQQSYERLSNDLQRVLALQAAQKAQLDNYSLLSPLDGIVLRRDGEEGEVAEPGSVLFWVGEPAPLQVVAEVNEEDIPKVEAGQKAWLKADAFPNTRLEANVSRITPKGDPVLKTYRVYLDQPGDTPLLIGMSVDVNIVTRTVEDTMLIPVSAVDADTVYVISENGRLQARKIELGIRGTEKIEVLKGLEEGDRVVAPLAKGLSDGMKVRAGPDGQGS